VTDRQIDRQTDGQTDGIAMAYTRYSYAVARKNAEQPAVSLLLTYLLTELFAPLHNVNKIKKIR